MSGDAPIKVDRQTTTPFLLKLFYKHGGFHRQEEFRSTSQPSSFVEIYTWKDCTLLELATLLSQALPEIAAQRSRCGFKLIYAETRIGRYTSKDLGTVTLPGDGEMDSVGRKTLDEIRFVTGDWIDVAIYPEGHGGVSGPGGRYGGGRENGFGGSVGGGGYRMRGLAGDNRAGRAFGGGSGGVPSGEWRRGERVEDAPPPSMRRESHSGGNGGGSSGGGGAYGGGRRGRGRW